MFYIIREYHDNSCWDIGYFNSYYTYSIDTTKPSIKDDFVKVRDSKDNLKNLVREKGSLQDALEYLFDIAKDIEEIDGAFD